MIRFTWLSVAMSLQCLWFGGSMISNEQWHTMPGLFPPIAAGVAIAIGALGVVFGIGGLLRPDWFALIAATYVCIIRGTQAWQTHNWYACGVWVILLMVMAFATMRDGTKPLLREGVTP